MPFMYCIYPQVSILSRTERQILAIATDISDFLEAYRVE